MSLHDGRGGDWPPDCPEDPEPGVTGEPRCGTAAPLDAEIERLKGTTRRLRTALMDVLGSENHAEAKRVARRCLADG